MNKPSIKARLSDLFLQDGKLSRTRTWGNIVNLVATFLIVWDTIHHELKAEILLIYLAIGEGSAFATKLLDRRIKKEATAETDAK